MPSVPLIQFKGLNLKPGDKVQMTVASIGKDEVQFEYVDPKDAPMPKAADYADKTEGVNESSEQDATSSDDNIQQPEKPLTEKDDASKMPLNELRSRLPTKKEE